jgi:SPX domain protein involved in polyphosphate accumulation
MKFGQHLTQNIQAEWARHYLSYKSLKRIIKSAIASKEAKVNPREAGDLQTINHRIHQCSLE